MNVPIYQVDAFASKLFAGNPAAICPLDDWLPDATLQSIASETNLFETEAEVRAVKPNMEKLAALDKFGIIVTAPGTDCDFVSRFFAPAAGVPEDPVTGSAHCTLIPYWSARLGKTKLFARQVSPRGGELWCEHRGDRVTMAGRAVKYLEGTIVVS